jgi:hypothetical protein
LPPCCRMTDEPKPKKEAWSSYPETVLVFAGEPEMMIDLREPLPPATKNALKAIGLGESFSVLTSYNPRGEDISAEENDRRFEELTSELRSAGIEFLVMDACSPDRSHCECSVVLKGDRDAAVDIAKRWEQVAIFWFDSARFWIYGAVSEIEPIPLPVRR